MVHGRSRRSRFWNDDYISYRRDRNRRRWRPNRTRPSYEVDYLNFSSCPEEERAGSASPASPRDRPHTPADDNDDVPAFSVKDVDLQKRANQRAHHTDEYEHTQLIVRRGQEFTIEVKVDKPFEKGEDVIKLQLAMGKEPLESKGTMFIITPGDSLELDDASAVIDDVIKHDGGSTIQLKMNLPHDSVVGRFTLYVRLRNKEDTGDDKKYTKHKVDEPIIVLFNPWCKDDTVYVEDDKERAEYVLNDTGRIYTGSSGRIRSRMWSFAQFDEPCLDAAMYIMDKSALPWAAYGNPVRVTRCLSAMVNSCDGKYGILTGNWSGRYDGGTSPTVWNGSEKILDEYMANKEPVKYGQCWVFSGVMTTVCRALGIPTRSVTNFNSAHDGDGSMTIDYHKDTDGISLKHLNRDSVWNFHVWNEGWFKRPDLPDGYDGWQAFDATPQEQSDGVMQCGPAPLAAIKDGNVHLGYDAKFIFGEVNGDRLTWEVDAEGGKKVTSVRTDSVGAYVSTKEVGSTDRNDVTDLYKYDENTRKERAIVKKVAQLSSKRKALETYYKLDKINDVDFKFDADVANNGNAEFALHVKNTSSDTRNITAHFHLMAKYYTGTEGDDIDNRKKTFELAAGGEETYSWTTKGADWLNKVDEDATIGIYVQAKVKETSQVFVTEDSYEIDKPDLDMQVSKSKIKVWEEVEVKIKFKNPLDIPLTMASLVIEGAGISKTKKIKISGAIAPGESISESLTIKPKMKGQREVVASFHSRQLVNIYGSVSIEVTADD